MGRRKKPTITPPTDDGMAELYGRQPVVASAPIPTTPTPTPTPTPSHSTPAPAAPSPSPSPSPSPPVPPPPFPHALSAPDEHAAFSFVSVPLLDSVASDRSRNGGVRPGSPALRDTVLAARVGAESGVHTRSGTLTFPLAAPASCSGDGADGLFVRVAAGVLDGDAFAPRSVGRRGGAEEFDGSAARLVVGRSGSACLSIAEHVEATMQRVVMVLCHGGYFAVAYFDGGKLAAHKTMRKYVTRRKQGGRQSTRDRSGRVMFSAGSHLRRTNEEKLATGIKELLASPAWAARLASAQRIFLFTPGPANREIFFGTAASRDASPPVIDPADPRIRSIALKTARPATAECVRIFALLATARVLTPRPPARPSPPSTPTLRTLAPTPGLLAAPPPPADPLSDDSADSDPDLAHYSDVYSDLDDLGSASGESAADDALFLEELEREQSAAGSGRSGTGSSHAGSDASDAASSAATSSAAIVDELVDELVDDALGAAGAVCVDVDDAACAASPPPPPSTPSPAAATPPASSDWTKVAIAAAAAAVIVAGSVAAFLRFRTPSRRQA